jgi:hypothetical protein
MGLYMSTRVLHGGARLSFRQGRSRSRWVGESFQSLTRNRRPCCPSSSLASSSSKCRLWLWPLPKRLFSPWPRSTSSKAPRPWWRSCSAAKAARLETLAVLGRVVGHPLGVGIQGVDVVLSGVIGGAGGRGGGVRRAGGHPGAGAGGYLTAGQSSAGLTPPVPPPMVPAEPPGNWAVSV